MILVTGATGFVGRHVVAELGDQPVRVLVLPDDPERAVLPQRVEVAVGDITQPATLTAALEGVDQVVHLAGLVNGGRGKPETFAAVNGQGARNLALAARRAGVKQLVFTSSVTVYGSVRDAVETSPLVPTPGYPASKIAAEQALREVAPELTTILRLPLVLGPGDRGFMAPALASLRKAGRVVILGSGQAPWSMLAVGDAARVVAFCLGRPETRGQVYNVPGDTGASGELLRAMGAGVGCTRETRIPAGVAWVLAALAELTGREGLTRDQVSALSGPMSMRGEPLARLGFTCATGWREALAEGIAWCAANP